MKPLISRLPQKPFLAATGALLTSCVATGWFIARALAAPPGPAWGLQRILPVLIYTGLFLLWGMLGRRYWKIAAFFGALSPLIWLLVRVSPHLGNQYFSLTGMELPDSWDVFHYLFLLGASVGLIWLGQVLWFQLSKRSGR